jgi:hypothetical protein
MQRLQQACASVLHNTVANHQMPFPHSCLPPFIAPANTSYHKRKKTTTMIISILAHLYTINLNINCYYVIKIIEMIK